MGVLAANHSGEVIGLFAEDVAELESGLSGRVIKAFAQSAEELGEEDAPADVGEEDAGGFFGGGRGGRRLFGKDLGEVGADTLLEVEGSELAAVDEAEDEPIDQGAEFLEQVEHEGGPAGGGLVEEADGRVEAGDQDLGFKGVAEEGVAEGETGVDGVARGSSGAAGEGEVVGEEQFAEVGEIEGGGSAFEAAKPVEIGLGGALFDQKAEAGEGVGQVGIAEAALGAEEDLALVGDFGGDDCAGQSRSESGIEGAAELVQAQGGGGGVGAREAGAEVAVGGQEDNVQPAAGEGGDGPGADFDAAEEEDLVEVGEADSAQQAAFAGEEESVALDMDVGALFGDGEGVHGFGRKKAQKEANQSRS